MVGIEVDFYCPNCNFDGIVDLGITDFVLYKGEKYSLRHCPKCKKMIAFKSREESFKLGHREMNGEGVEVKAKVIGIISKTPNLLDKREEEILSFIKSELGKSFSSQFMKNNEYEIQTIIEFVLSNKIYTTSHIYEDIKDDCSYAGTTCY